MMTLPTDNRFETLNFIRYATARNSYGDVIDSTSMAIAISGDLQPAGAELKILESGKFTGKAFYCFYESGSLLEGDILTYNGSKLQVTGIAYWGTHYEAVLREIRL